jgi:hypothetical protein
MSDQIDQMLALRALQQRRIEDLNFATEPVARSAYGLLDDLLNLLARSSGGFAFVWFA